MTPSCLRVRAALAASVGGHASDAERLEIESHLAVCARCESERVRWQLVRRLRDSQLPGLSEVARERVRQAFLSAPRAPELAAAPRRSPIFAVGGALATALAVALLLIAPRVRNRRILDGDVRFDGERIASAHGGRVRLAGPTVTLVAGTDAVWHPASRTVVLERGSVTVEVDPHQGKSFRVATARFTVEVVGTIFTVDLEGVRTSRGKVRVVDNEGTELATVAAGQAWSVPAAGAPPVQPPPATAPVPIERAPQPVRAAPSAATRLALARQLLARGDAAAARAIVRPLLGGPHAGAAEARALFAESYLVERRYSDAMDSYQMLVRDYKNTTQAESALYAIAQLEIERGARDDAARSLRHYLERYPSGRFVREARDRLARLAQKRTP